MIFVALGSLLLFCCVASTASRPLFVLLAAGIAVSASLLAFALAVINGPS